MTTATEFETNPSHFINDLRNSVERLIFQMGGKTHADFQLRHGGRETIQSSCLMDAAKSFLLTTMDGDELGITLHMNEEGETPYTEIFFGRPGTLRGIQCHTDNGCVLISLRQNFDATTLMPLNPDVTTKLRNYLNQNHDAPFSITNALLRIAWELVT